MSSEETLSVGGSEEVGVMEHEEMSVETESSGLERIEEVIGGDEGILSNILEVEGVGGMAILKKPKKKSKTSAATENCRKKVKAQHPKLDVTTFTFRDQEGGVAEKGDSKTVDFHPKVKLRWDHDNDGRTIFPPKFDFNFVVVEEEAEVAGGAEVGENKP
ncbi:hypothetical protein SLEP1_g49450 [Rubroshorea leprosula]|uniref:Uncharacterized protein n=1 Tax=Rubroshorea leprosula TaxID=152421 RepID=A0AAV5LZ36_9ROSI|nr:hypothetical protein SLEP1_g49450 [Rubroshorea leprosula]